MSPDAEIVPFPEPVTICNNCGYRAAGGQYCWKHRHVVPDNYVCSDYALRGASMLWPPGENKEGD